MFAPPSPEHPLAAALVRGAADRKIAKVHALKQGGHGVAMSLSSVSVITNALRLRTATL